MNISSLQEARENELRARQRHARFAVVAEFGHLRFVNRRIFDERVEQRNDFRVRLAPRQVERCAAVLCLRRQGSTVQQQRLDALLVALFSSEMQRGFAAERFDSNSQRGAVEQEAHDRCLTLFARAVQSSEAGCVLGRDVGAVTNQQANGVNMAIARSFDERSCAAMQRFIRFDAFLEVDHQRSEIALPSRFVYGQFRRSAAKPVQQKTS